MQTSRVNMKLNVVSAGITEKEAILKVGDVVEYMGHVPGGMVKIKLAGGVEDIAHPACFAELR